MHTTRTSSRMQCLALCALFERNCINVRILLQRDLFAVVCMNCMQITVEGLFANYFKLSQDFHDMLFKIWLKEDIPFIISMNRPSLLNWTMK